jgi:membrane-bound inhibitor of C-type lysozyme
MQFVRHAWFASVALIVCAGCERDAKAPESTAAAPDGATAAASAGTSSSDAAPQPVQHWECDGGTELTTKYLPRDRAISLGLHEGERKLPQVASASGEKYQEGPITFWSKGGSAIYERAPAPQVACRLSGA